MIGHLDFIERIVDAAGQKSIILTATDYPYSNLQVLPLNDTNSDKILSSFGEGETVARVDGRDDFAVIIVGGSVMLEVTQENCGAAGKSIIEACHQAAVWWNQHHPSPVDYDNLSFPVIGVEEYRIHPTYNGKYPAPLPDGYLEAWAKEYLKH